MGNFNFDYMTRCAICDELIRFDNPFLAHYDRVCKELECIKMFDRLKKLDAGEKVDFIPLDLDSK